MFAVNLMDRDRASFVRTLEALQKKYGRDVVPLQLPIGEESLVLRRGRPAHRHRLPPGRPTRAAARGDRGPGRPGRGRHRRPRGADGDGRRAGRGADGDLSRGRRARRRRRCAPAWRGRCDSATCSRSSRSPRQEHRGPSDPRRPRRPGAASRLAAGQSNRERRAEGARRPRRAAVLGLRLQDHLRSLRGPHLADAGVHRRDQHGRHGREPDPGRDRAPRGALDAPGQGADPHRGACRRRHRRGAQAQGDPHRRHAVRGQELDRARR